MCLIMDICEDNVLERLIQSVWCFLSKISLCTFAYIFACNLVIAKGLFICT